MPAPGIWSTSEKMGSKALLASPFLLLSVVERFKQTESDQKQLVSRLHSLEDSFAR